MRVSLHVPAMLGLLCIPLPAQDNSELLNRVKAMEERIIALEAEIRTMKAQAAPPDVSPPAQPPGAVGAPVVPQAQAGPNLGGAGGAASKVLNPDISVIGDFIGAVGNGGNRGVPSLEMHESEVGLQEVIDPYARGDFFISFGERGVNLEEGYLTFTALPAGLQLRVGKMRAAFGKVNTLHNHVLPWTDRPLVTQNLVGGEDGINDAGLSLSRILPSIKGLFFEGTAQVFRGDSENIFAAPRRRNVAAVAHLRGYSDLSESTNLDVGVSYARGHSPFGDGSNQLFGADATLRWKPLRRAIYHSFVGRSEVVWARTAVSPFGLFPDRGATTTARPFGFYVAGDYQLGRRWFLGGRFDRSSRVNCLPTEPPTLTECDSALPLNGLLRDTAGSLLLTYWPSEFSQVRGQLRRTRFGEGLTANELIFQFVFSLGAHGAHPF